MENNQSLLSRFTSVAGQVGAILNRYDIDMLDRQQLKLVGTIKRLLADARLDIRDWEMSDSRAEMQQNAKQAVERIGQARAAILMASEQDLFTAVDIAEVSAKLEVVSHELQSQ